MVCPPSELLGSNRCLAIVLANVSPKRIVLARDRILSIFGYRSFLEDENVLLLIDAGC